MQDFSTVDFCEYNCKVTAYPNIILEFSAHRTRVSWLALYCSTTNIDEGGLKAASYTLVTNT